jgi:hypothetical protein
MRARGARWTRALGGPGAPVDSAPAVDAADLDPVELDRRVFGSSAREQDDVPASRAPEADPPLSV